MSGYTRHDDDSSFWAGEQAPASRGDDLTCWVCGRLGHMAIACPLHPARLSRIRGEACGPGPCTGACRSGDHGDCGFHWCTCVCHRIELPMPAVPF